MMVTAPEDRATSAACVALLSAMNLKAERNPTYCQPLSIVDPGTGWSQGGLYPTVSRRPNMVPEHLPLSDCCRNYARYIPWYPC